MKKSLMLMLVAIMSITFNPMYASNNKPVTPIENAVAAAHAESLINRLNEIKDMDKSEMSRAEKRELRKEVKAIKADLNSSGNGIYLSVGAIIIVILLLILIIIFIYNLEAA